MIYSTRKLTSLVAVLSMAVLASGCADDKKSEPVATPVATDAPPAPTAQPQEEVAAEDETDASIDIATRTVDELPEATEEEAAEIVALVEQPQATEDTVGSIDVAEGLSAFGDSFTTAVSDYRRGGPSVGVLIPTDLATLKIFDGAFDENGQYQSADDHNSQAVKLVATAMGQTGKDREDSINHAADLIVNQGFEQSAAEILPLNALVDQMKSQGKYSADRQSVIESLSQKIREKVEAAEDSSWAKNTALYGGTSAAFAVVAGRIASPTSKYLGKIKINPNASANRYTRLMNFIASSKPGRAISIEERIALRQWNKAAMQGAKKGDWTAFEELKAANNGEVPAFAARTVKRMEKAFKRSGRGTVAEDAADEADAVLAVDEIADLNLKVVPKAFSGKEGMKEAYQLLEGGSGDLAYRKLVSELGLNPNGLEFVALPGRKAASKFALELDTVADDAAEEVVETAAKVADDAAETAAPAADNVLESAAQASDDAAAVADDAAEEAAESAVAITTRRWLKRAGHSYTHVGDAAKNFVRSIRLKHYNPTTLEGVSFVVTDHADEGTRVVFKLIDETGGTQYIGVKAAEDATPDMVRFVDRLESEVHDTLALVGPFGVIRTKLRLSQLDNVALKIKNVGAQGARNFQRLDGAIIGLVTAGVVDYNVEDQALGDVTYDKAQIDANLSAAGVEDTFVEVQ